MTLKEEKNQSVETIPELAQMLELADEDIKTVAVTMFKKPEEGFPGGAVVENLPANAGDTGSSPGLGRSHMPRSN